jgi:SNF2 family DNA or RNA helicase
MMSKFKLGEVVRLVNTNLTGVICEEPKDINGKIYYVLYIDNSRKTYSEESIEPTRTQKSEAITTLTRKEFVPLKDFTSYLTYIKVERPLSNNLYSFLSSRTEFQVHQFKPLLKYLGSPYQRLLIADEVGVGKTIEAGIIYTELLSRQDLRNVLIVCPPSLRYKWQKELKKRFNENLEIIDSQKVKLFCRKYDKYPNSVSLKGIVSLQTLRNEEILKELERLQVPWDLVIIDEAHHMRNSETKNNELGKILSSTAEGMLLLSATPLQLGQKDLFNLFNIMLPEEFNNFNTFEEQVKPNEYINLALTKISKNAPPQSILRSLRTVEITNQSERFKSNPNYNFCVDLLNSRSVLGNDDIATLQRKLNELNVLSHIYTRTKKNEISIEFPIREPVTIKVEFNDVERQFYDNVSDLFLSIHPDCPPGFLLQMPCRQVASCIPAAITYLKDIYSSGVVKLEIDDDDDEILLNTKNKEIKLTKNDLLKIKDLVLFAQDNLKQQDSKTREFLKTITQVIDTGEIKKVVIFSFFKRTLRYLELLLKEKGFSTARIDGDVPFNERENIVENFSSPEGYQILLYSDVGGEGLDMQFCNCVFNYDLPWNPMKIEQRIGRFDRYGQMSSKIHIYNFSIENTIESDIFLRLCNRIGVFQQYIGELEPILGREIKQLTAEIFNIKLTQEQQKERADKIALVIEKKKQELELFDKERTKFIGQDNYFTEQVSDIMKNEKFITSSEIINLISSFIDEKYPKSKLSLSSKEKIYKLKVDSEYKDFIIGYLNKRRHYSESSEKFTDLVTRESFEITFDYKVANSNSSIEFITFRHPLVKSIIEKYKEEDELKNACCITWQEVSLEEGIAEQNYLFFIYLLEISAFTKSLTFVPVVVDIHSHIVHKEYSEKLFHILKNSDDLSEYCEMNSESIKACSVVSENYVISLARQQETDLKDVNESLINDRLSSLQQTFEIKIQAINETLGKLNSSPDKKSDRILRMKESQKFNLKRNFENKRTELEADKRVIVSHELISGGYLNVRR